MSQARGWTARDIPDLTGRSAVVTGANSGLGLQTALELARHGAGVVLACRDPARGQEALRRVRAAAPAAADRVELDLLDLADLASVRAFAARRAAAGPLDLLVNNAGVMAVPLRRTADGFELQFGTNHLGHFALTGLLLAQLLARPGARVVTVSSGAHRAGRIDFANLGAERGYGAWRAYSQSKLANLLFTAELDRRARAAGRDLVAVAAHPGFAATELQRTSARMSGRRLVELAAAGLTRLAAQPAAAGALPVLYAATAADVVGGEYFGPAGPLEARGRPARVPRSARATDAETARRLWSVSEQLTGVDFVVPSAEMLPPQRSG